MMNDFNVLIVGNDANAYYMGRCCFEKYHKKAHLIGKKKMAFTKYSDILTIEYEENLWQEKQFINSVNNYANKVCKEKVLLISTNETYSEFISKNQDKLASNLVYPHQNYSVLTSLTNKEKFYKLYYNSLLDFPKTYYLDINSFDLPPLKYPLIIKPANVISYNHLDFNGKNKIYKVETPKEAHETIAKIQKSGYKDKLIFQEYIKGDDSHLFDSVVYVDKNHHVKVISFAQIGLQERTKEMVGNAATLINGYSTFKQAPIKEMKQKIINFMENINYTGFAEIDMKYDEEKQKFIVLEINARQGRCSYYLTKLDANLVETLVDDLIYQKELPKKDLEKKVLLSFVPKNIVKKYITNKEFQNEALKMWKKRIRPMETLDDKNFYRFLLMRKRLHNYRKEYKRAYWNG